MAATIDDQLAIQDLTTRYAQHLSRHEIDDLVALFLPDAIYHAFNTDYSMEEFPALLTAAPRGQLIVNPPLIDIDGDLGTGSQHYIFIDQRTHDMRLAWYDDLYTRTESGWRFARRTTTFLRRNGSMDHGKEHDPIRP
ncbi:MAG: hypothetical protein ACI9C1_003995 [Candidatus Aldehydirespiratoraceae bacterium]|jgi:hypothetical protein